MCKYITYTLTVTNKQIGRQHYITYDCCHSDGLSVASPISRRISILGGIYPYCDSMSKWSPLFSLYLIYAGRQNFRYVLCIFQYSILIMYLRVLCWFSDIFGIFHMLNKV